MGLGLRYSDDRGGTLRSKPPFARNAARHARVERRSAARHLRPLRVFSVSCFSLMCVLIAGAYLSPALLPGRPSQVLMLVLPIVIIVAVTLVLTPWLRPMGWRLHRRGLLGLGLCPGCGYQVAKLATEPDGCRVCPECGAAWKLDAPASPPPS